MIIHEDFKRSYQFKGLFCTKNIYIASTKLIRKISVICTFMNEYNVLYEEDRLNTCEYHFDFLGYFTNINTLNDVKIILEGYQPYDDLECVILYFNNEYMGNVPEKQKFNEEYEMCYLNFKKIIVKNSRIITI